MLSTALINTLCALQFGGGKNEYALSRCSRHLPRASPELELTKPGDCFMFAEKRASFKRLKNSSCSLARVRYPKNSQWDALQRLQSNLMEPESFIQYWQVTQKDLAKICFCSVRTVERWFGVGSWAKQPTVYHKLCLALTHKLWMKLLSDGKSV
jgi:hypothetical protein